MLLFLCVDEIVLRGEVFMDNNKDDKICFDKDGIHISENGKDSVHISDKGIHIHHNDKDFDVSDSKLPRYKYYNTIKSTLYSLTFLAITATYLLLGFLLPNNEGWANWWPLFFLIPVIPSLYEAIANRAFCRFLMPVLVAAVYCFIGMQWNLWHPWWILFFIVPAYYIIFGPVDSAIKRYRIKKYLTNHTSFKEDDDDDDDVIDATK